MEPSIRARSVTDSIRWADSFEGASGQVSKAIPEDVLSFLEGALPSSWVPLESDRHVIRAILEVHGEDGARRCWRSMMADHTDTPLLRGIFRTARTLFGATPGSVAKIAPRAWVHVYRNVSQLHLMSRGPNHAVLRMSELAPVLDKEPGYFVCFAAVVEGISDLFGGAEVEVQRGAGVVDLEMAW